MQNNTRCLKRLQKELEDMKKFDEQFKLEVDDKARIWRVSFTGAESTLYAGEKFTLQFKFSADYVL